MKQILISGNGDIRQFDTIAENLIFFYKIIPVKMPKNCCSNLPDFQRHSHTREKNSHLTFLWDMRNIPHL